MRGTKIVEEAQAEAEVEALYVIAEIVEVILKAEVQYEIDHRGEAKTEAEVQFEIVHLVKKVMREVQVQFHVRKVPYDLEALSEMNLQNVIAHDHKSACV
jgi:hypothetical protein